MPTMAGWTMREAKKLAGIASNGHCAAVSFSRAVADDPADTREVAQWLPVVDAMLDEAQGVSWNAETGTLSGDVAKAAEALGLDARRESYLGRSPRDGNPYGDGRRTRRGVRMSDGTMKIATVTNPNIASNDRRYDCPTVTQWLRDNPNTKALLRVDGHVGFAADGVAFDLQARHRVDYAVVLEA